MNSLVVCAAPFSPEDNVSNNNESATKIEKVRNRTLKNRKLNDKDNINEIISRIHNTPENDNDDDNTLSDFSPPPPPSSIGVNKTIEKSNEEHNKRVNMVESNTALEQIYSGNDVSNEMYDDMHIENNHQYFKKVVPMYKEEKEYPKQIPAPNKNMYNKNEISQKLNYMISLLEEQQDEKTGHVFEELILYSFLGIFIIFVVDSFARAGKYVR